MPGLIIKVSGLYLGQNSNTFLAFHHLCMIRSLTQLSGPHQQFHPIVSQPQNTKLSYSAQCKFPSLFSSITHGISPQAESQGEEIMWGFFGLFFPQGSQALH